VQKPPRTEPWNSVCFFINYFRKAFFFDSLMEIQNSLKQQAMPLIPSQSQSAYAINALQAIPIAGYGISVHHRAIHMAYFSD